MATDFREIYDLAVCRFRDYSWLKFSDEDREHFLKNYLVSACKDFAPVCKENLSDVDEYGLAFTADLSDEVKDILASGVAYYWYASKAMNSELLRNQMSTKDYSFFSPANLLREITTLKENLWKEYQHAITMYTYRNGDIMAATN